MARDFSLQALSPKKAHFCLAVERFMQQELGLNLQGKRVLLGYSGGPDSTALLLCFHALAPKLGLVLAAAHIHHGIRPESAQEEKDCTALCRSLGIPLFVHQATVPDLAASLGTGLEETARTVRYEFFASLQSCWPYDFLALGHHLDDLAEDVFLRLLRGTGWPALGGMVAHDTRRALLRPFLHTPKVELEEFLHTLPVAVAHDASNDADNTLRNRIRHHVVPFFLKENPQFLRSVAGLSKLARDDTSFFAQQLEDLLPGADNASNACFTVGKANLQEFGGKGLNKSLQSITGVKCSGLSTVAPEAGTAASGNSPASPQMACTLEKMRLQNLPRSLRLRLYKRCLDSLGPGQALLPNLLDLDTCWLRGKGGSIIQFPGGKTAKIHKGNILFAFPAREV